MIAAIILAAGESSRMGRLKQLLPWDGTTLLDWQVQEARAAGIDEVVIVVGHEAETIRASLASSETKARVVLNEGYLEGRASSLRRGSEAIDTSAEAVVVMSVDQPRPAWVTHRLIERWRETGAPIVVPRIGGRGGHPILLDGSLIPQVRHVEDSSLGLRAVVEAHRDQVETVVIDHEGLEVNLNTPDDYEAAKAAFERDDWSEP